MSEGVVAAQELRLLIERAERLIAEKDDIAADVRDVFGEAKARGYDPATMRAIIKRRKMEREKRQEQDALLATYCAALGLDYDGPEPSTPRASKVPTPLEEAIGKFEKATEGVAVTMSVSGGPEVPINKAARAKVGKAGDLYTKAIASVKESGKASVSLLQRKLQIGYNQAASMIEEMERDGIVSKPDATGKRDLLALAQKVYDAGGRVVGGALVMPIT